MTDKVCSAVNEYFLLHSTCNDVRSKSLGGVSLPSDFLTDAIVNGISFISSSKASASSFLSNLPCFKENSTSRYMVFNSQYGTGTKLSISCWRFTTKAKVGVCTRPTDNTDFPLPYFMVYNLVALMPNNQSPIARAQPAAYKLSKSLPSRKLSNPSLMASSVSDDIHKRFTGLPALLYCITHRWINSPSCPASPQLMISSAWANNFLITSSCRTAPSLSNAFMPKRSGIIGSVPIFQYFQRAS